MKTTYSGFHGIHETKTNKKPTTTDLHRIHKDGTESQNREEQIRPSQNSQLTGQNCNESPTEMTLWHTQNPQSTGQTLIFKESTAERTNTDLQTPRRTGLTLTFTESTADRKNTELYRIHSGRNQHWHSRNSQQTVLTKLRRIYSSQSKHWTRRTQQRKGLTTELPRIHSGQNGNLRSQDSQRTGWNWCSKNPPWKRQTRLHDPHKNPQRTGQTQSRSV